MHIQVHITYHTDTVLRSLGCPEAGPWGLPAAAEAAQEAEQEAREPMAPRNCRLREGWEYDMIYLDMSMSSTYIYLQYIYTYMYVYYTHIWKLMCIYINTCV